MTVKIMIGDSLEILRTLPSDSFHCCVTSPPYYGLRDYGVDGQMGLEATPQEFIANMVTLFEEVRRVLRPDGTCWVNMGDSYARTGGTDRKISETALCGSTRNTLNQMSDRTSKAASGFKSKDLMMMPHRLAIALQDAGWYVRQDIVWSKPNPMPESVTDRCTKSHEYIFLLTKSERYYYDAAAIAEPVADSSVARLSQDLESQSGSDRVPGKTNGAMKAVARGVGWGHGTDAEKRQRGRVKKSGPNAFRGQGSNRIGEKAAANRDGRDLSGIGNGLTRNKRSVWTMATQPYKEAHFATFPPELPETCIKAGCPEGGTVLDPFFGAGTTGLVADRLQRDCIGIELNPAYAEIARKRIQSESSLFAEVLVA